MGHLKFDRVEIFEAISLPEIAHFFYRNGLDSYLPWFAARYQAYYS